MPPPPPALPDELLEEVFFRLSPDEPEHLARASLVSKVWLALLSDPRFRARYRDFHGAPPMLGFLCSGRTDSLLSKVWGFLCPGRIDSVREVGDNIPHFFPTTKFPARIPDDDWGGWGYTASDCRHGRVLLGDDYSCDPHSLVVWDPMTGCRRELDHPGQVGCAYGAAVLCAVAGCDHRACHAGPFQVAYIGIDTIQDDGECFASACVSSPMTADWSKPCSESRLDKWGEPCSALHVGSVPFWDGRAPVFLEDALHVKLMYQEDDHIEILKYDLGSNCLSLIHAPLAGSVRLNAAILMAMEDGSLGFAHEDKLTLHLWSRQRGSDGIASWTQRTAVSLNNHLPIQNPNKRLRLIGSVEGSDIIFVNMGLDIYELNLKTLRWKKLQKREKLCGLIPYMSFYNPQETVIPGDAVQ